MQPVFMSTVHKKGYQQKKKKLFVFGSCSPLPSSLMHPNTEVGDKKKKRRGLVARYLVLASAAKYLSLNLSAEEWKL